MTIIIDISVDVPNTTYNPSLSTMDINIIEIDEMFINFNDFYASIMSTQTDSNETHLKIELSNIDTEITNEQNISYVETAINNKVNINNIKTNLQVTYNHKQIPYKLLNITCD